ncbi:hypothetical protein ACHHYP_17018 [Achlya hypogyna]|uniref:Uncharacterized protein n=1 Tax=Achlya hypogyna TaxID=1202772 RepID=A0A1V9ZDM5_ACHHY|nr:hypothetical protein ACHHYP_17018 [Achlya hypogyna]
MGLRKKVGKPAGRAKEDDEDVNQGEGLSLDEYFNSKKDYSVEAMKETSELLDKTKDDAMVMTRVDDDEEAAPATIPICAMNEGDDDDHVYEDDYETETEPAAPNAVAGLSLSDYLTGPKKEAKKKPKKDDTANIEGMSLESYLGASSLDDDANARKAASKRPKPTEKPKATLAAALPTKKKAPAPKKRDGDAFGARKNQGAILVVAKKKPYGKAALLAKESPTKQDPLPKLAGFSCKAYGGAPAHDDDESRLPPLPH